jgi:hypothetical protein
VKTRSVLILALAIANACSCDTNERRLVVHKYSDGTPKALVRLKDGRRDGLCTYYYPGGGLKYEGEYAIGIRIGKHTDYYEVPMNQPSQVSHYEIIEGASVVTKLYLYDSTGLMTLESNFVQKKVKVTELSQTRFLGDTLLLSVEIADRSLPMSAVILRNVDQYLNPQDTLGGTYFGEGEDGQVVIKVPLNRSGQLHITGIAREFNIVPVNDSIGVTVANDAYFEHVVQVLPMPGSS